MLLGEVPYENCLGFLGLPSIGAKEAIAWVLIGNANPTDAWSFQGIGWLTSLPN